MSEVKRYTPIHSEREMLGHYEGEYVLHSDYEKLKAQLEKAEEVLKYYSDRMNYTLDDDYGISGEMCRRVILYGDQEEFNEYSSAAGRRSRQYFKEKEQV